MAKSAAIGTNPTNGKEQKKEKAKKKTCGIIMPIAPHKDYPDHHWKDVLSIIQEAILDTEFEARLVSDDEAIGQILDRIVTNIYNDEIVVVDVSTKNPNVMFELGLRLAFDKPTVIIKDENANYSFDIGGIEHLDYPSSLRFNKIQEFKKELAKKVTATYKKKADDPSFSPFLGTFGKKIQMTPATIKETEIPMGDYIIDELKDLKQQIGHLTSLSKDFQQYRGYKKVNVVQIPKSLIEQAFSELNIEPNSDIDINEVARKAKIILGRKGLIFQDETALKNQILEYIMTF